MFRKFISRKLFAAVAAIVVGAFAPQLLPFLKILAPTYIGAQGVADAAGALAGALKKE